LSIARPPAGPSKSSQNKNLLIIKCPSSKKIQRKTAFREKKVKNTEDSSSKEKTLLAPTLPSLVTMKSLKAEKLGNNKYLKASTSKPNYVNSRTIADQAKKLNSSPNELRQSYSNLRRSNLKILPNSLNKFHRRNHSNIKSRNNTSSLLEEPSEIKIDSDSTKNKSLVVLPKVKKIKRLKLKRMNMKPKLFSVSDDM